MSNLVRAVAEEMFSAFAVGDVERFVATVSDDTVWIYHGTQVIPKGSFGSATFTTVAVNDAAADPSTTVASRVRPSPESNSIPPSASLTRRTLDDTLIWPVASTFELTNPLGGGTQWPQWRHSVAPSAD